MRPWGLGVAHASSIDAHPASSSVVVEVVGRTDDIGQRQHERVLDAVRQLAGLPAAGPTLACLAEQPVNVAAEDQRDDLRIVLIAIDQSLMVGAGDNG